jgi:hypothetical protein
MDSSGGTEATGTAVVAASCDGAGSQQWTQGAGNTLTDSAGLCLTDPNSSTTNGVQLQIVTCSGGSNQVWPLPAAPAPPAPPATGPVFSNNTDSSTNTVCMTN